jgi:hypothetical protein
LIDCNTAASSTEDWISPLTHNDQIRIPRPADHGDDP